MRSRPVFPVITGKTTKRYLSTSPAASRERQRLKLPSVLNVPDRVRFSSRTASTASPEMSSELGHTRGSFSVEEKMILGMAASPVKLAPSSSENPELSPDASSDMLDITRYVVAPMRVVKSFFPSSSSQAKYSGPSKPHQPGHPSAEA
ncbi:hypothetical protein D3C73_1237200 [compost metagenome]